MWRGADRTRSQVILTEYRYDHKAKDSKSVYLVLDEQEQEMLARNCAARRPGRDPYEMAEYIALLIRQDDARVRGRINAISKRRCSKCGDALLLTFAYPMTKRSDFPAASGKHTNVISE
ncbi:hypothetical protein [Klebsiella quasipneumoniae]|uniref:hypothetical protein n=1 Tax=Klebsiella quasipneumoniae TaxID=1463165 RepID=UPI003B213935